MRAYLQQSEMEYEGQDDKRAISWLGRVTGWEQYGWWKVFGVRLSSKYQVELFMIMYYIILACGQSLCL